MEEGSLNFPNPEQLPGSNMFIPYFLIGDEAFPLRTDLMRPYPRRNLRAEAHRIFNCRLSRARLTIENAFGILASRYFLLNIIIWKMNFYIKTSNQTCLFSNSNRWRVLRSALAHHPNNAESIILATVCLHNFVMNREEHLQRFKQYCPPSYVDHEDDNGNILPGE